MKPVKRFVRSHQSLMDAVTSIRRAYNGSPARGRIAMFHVGRCGSTVLTEILDQHSQIHWGKELFDDVKLSNPGFQTSKRWVRAVIEFELYRHRCGYFGFETKSTQLGPHCIGMTVEEYVSFLVELGFSHFIVLTRSNLLRVIISSIVGGQTGKWHVSSAAAEPTRVRIDPAKPWGSWAGSIIDILNIFERYYANLYLPLRGRNRLDLNYEIDIEHDSAVGYRKVCGFLGIEPEPFEIRLARTNSFSIEKMVINFNEVSAALHGTRFEWMLTA